MGRTEKETGPGTTVCGYKTEREPRQSMHSASGRKTVGVAPCTRVCLADLADAHALVLFSARMSGDGGGSASYIPSELQEAVLLKSVPMPADSLEVKGHDFSEVWKEGKGVDYHALLSSYRTSGFQATNFGLAVEQINLMLKARGERVPEEKKKPYLCEPGERPVTNCTIFLGYTSNLISSGIRDTLRYLVQHNMVDVIVSSAGGVEEDFIKCLAPTFLGDFSLCGRELRLKGINRIGNLLVPNDNYVKFEEWIMPIFDRMLEEQKTEGVVWTPSKMITRLGREIDNPDSVYYWAFKNNIPVFCPALTDGSMGDMIYIHSYKNPGLIIDIAHDIRRINSLAVKAANTGMIILGGGMVKHHICNANLMRNGADYAVFVNTAQEFDGSDAGARPDEAVSWGKIRATARPVKVYGEATLVFPLLVAETFAREYRQPPALQPHSQRSTSEENTAETEAA